MRGLILPQKKNPAAVCGFSFLEDSVQVDSILYEIIQIGVFVPLHIIIGRFSDPAVSNERGSICGRRENPLIFFEKGRRQGEIPVDAAGRSDHAVLYFDYSTAPVSFDRVIFLVRNDAFQGRCGEHRIHFVLVNGVLFCIGKGGIEVFQHPVYGLQLLCVPAAHFVGEDQFVCSQRDQHKSDH